MTELELYSTEADLEVIRQFGNAAAVRAIAEVLRNTDLTAYHTAELTSTLVHEPVREVTCTPIVRQPVSGTGTHWLPVTILAIASVSVAALVCVVVAVWILAHVAVVLAMAALGLLFGIVLRSQRVRHQPQHFSGTFEGSLK